MEKSSKMVVGPVYNPVLITGSTKMCVNNEVTDGLEEQAKEFE